MFRPAMCPLSGELIASMRHRVYVILSRWQSGVQVWIPTCIPDGRLHRVTYTKCRIDTNNSPDDGHMAGCPKHVENRNKHINKLCIKLVYLQRLYKFMLSEIVYNFTATFLKRLLKKHWIIIYNLAGHKKIHFSVFYTNIVTALLWRRVVDVETRLRGGKVWGSNPSGGRRCFLL